MDQQTQDRLDHLKSSISASLQGYVGKPLNIAEMRSMVFEIVADHMPTLGRDYTLDVVPHPDGPDKVKVQMRSLTVIGEVYVRYLMGVMEPDLRTLARKMESKDDGHEADTAGNSVNAL